MEMKVWDDQRVEALKRCIDQGLTASQIAAELGGVSRNAVIGKVQRLGLTLETPHGGQPGLRKPRRQGPGFVDPHRGTEPTILVSAPIEPVVLPASAGMVDVVNALKSGHCRWPVGDPLEPGFRFCCAPRLVSRDRSFPYCRVHCAQAYAPAAG